MESTKSRICKYGLDCKALLYDQCNDLLHLTPGTPLPTTDLEKQDTFCSKESNCKETGCPFIHSESELIDLVK